MKKKITYTLNVLLIVAIGFATLKLIFNDGGLKTFMHDFNQSNKVWLIIGILLVLLFVCSESVIIKYMLKMFNTKVPLLRCIKYSFIGFFFSYITPSATGGQPAQIFYMKKDGIKIGYSTLIMMVIAFTYKLVLVLLGLIFIIFKFSAMCGYMGKLIWLVIVGFVLNLAFISVLAMLIIKPEWMRSMGIKVINLLSKIRIIRNTERFVNKINRICDNYSICANYIKDNLGAVVKIMLITAVQRIFLFAVTFVVYKSYGLSGISFFDIIAIQTLIAVAVEMLPVPGAAGITEGCFLSMFAPVFGDRYIKSGMLLSRGISFYVLLIVGAIVTAIAHLIMARKDMKKQKA